MLKIGGIMKLEKTVILLCVLMFLFSDCIEMIKQQEWQLVKVRIPFSPKVKAIYSKQEYVSVRVRKGDCLSRVIERVFSKYIKRKGYKGDYTFSESIYSFVKTISKSALKSGNKNLIYPGEVIRFKLPYKIVLKKVSDYYLPAKKVYDIERLKQIIDFKWLVNYQVNYFDCSERSAFVEYLLENEGFNADIVSNENHCWVIVEVKPGKYVDVEAVANPPYIITDKPYLHCYNSIYEAMQRNADEYDWWNVAKEHKEFISRKVSW